jgi:hypothetical protein
MTCSNCDPRLTVFAAVGRGGRKPFPFRHRFPAFGKDCAGSGLRQIARAVDMRGHVAHRPCASVRAAPKCPPASITSSLRSAKDFAGSSADSLAVPREPALRGGCLMLLP